MHFHATAVITTVLAASLAEAKFFPYNVGASPAQISAYISDASSIASSIESQPSFTAFFKEIKPYLPHDLTPAQIQDGSLPSNRAELSTFVKSPLALATATPGFVQKMPPKPSKAFIAFRDQELKLAASIANKDLLHNPSAAPKVLPGLGWGLGLAAGAVGLVAVML